MEKTPILVGITGASGTPLAVECLRQLRKHPEYEIHLILTQSARLALSQETTLTVAEFEAMADVVHDNDSRGDAPASGTFRSAGMLIVPCSMKTAAGICAGYADSLLLRAADVTIKEKRPLVLAARETPLSPIHLRNLAELARLQNVWIVPPMLSYYDHPVTVEDMTRQAAGKLLNCFGIEAEGYKRWNGPV